MCQACNATGQPWRQGLGAGLLHGLAGRGSTAATLAAAFDDEATRTAVLAVAAACGALATTRHGSFAALPDAGAVRELIDRSRP